MNRNSVILGDNDLKFSVPLAERLENEGFDVFHGRTWNSVYPRVLDKTPQLLVLDLALPGMNGLAVCREIRAIFDGLILVLTSQDNDFDQILAFELGADDFVIKPVHLRVLTARIRALFRRSYRTKTNEKSKSISIGDLTVDAARREAFLDGRLLDLTTVQFDLLWYLISNAGNIVSRDDICRAIHDTDYNGIDRSIDVYISRIRQKLGDDSSKPYYLKTVRGTGYLFAGEKHSPPQNQIR